MFAAESPLSEINHRWLARDVGEGKPKPPPLATSDRDRSSQLNVVSASETH
jgi:hypothetical protein